MHGAVASPTPLVRPISAEAAGAVKGLASSRVRAGQFPGPLRSAFGHGPAEA